MALLAGTHSSLENVPAFENRHRSRQPRFGRPQGHEEWGSAEGLQSNRWRAPGPRMPIMAWQQFEVNGPLELDLPITRRVP
jgi:hypothetical protein